MSNAAGFRFAVAAVLAAILAVAGGCRRGGSADRQLMKTIAGKWVSSTKGASYTTVRELELTDNGRYTETTSAEVGGQRKAVYYNEYRAEIQIEPGDPEKLKALKKDGFVPLVEKGQYRVELVKGSGRVIRFERDDKGGSDDATGMGRQQRRLEVLSTQQIKIGPNTYNRI